MDGYWLHRVVWLLLLVTLSLAKQKAFVVVCYDTGANDPNITVKISGVRQGNIEMDKPFTQKSHDVIDSYQFLTYEGRSESQTYAFLDGLSSSGSYFVYYDGVLNDEDRITTQVTYESGLVFEGYTAIPLQNLGLDYYAVTFCEIFGFCQIFIVAVDDTGPIKVTVTLPDTHKVHNVMYGSQNYDRGNDITISMAPKQTALIECQCDLTGTRIKSDHLVAVFSGSNNAVVGVNGHANFLIEQLPPFNKWGKEYVCSCQQYCKKYGAFIRVLSKEDTTVHIRGYMKVKTTANNPWIHRRVEPDDLLYITADRPILVVMFLLSTPKHTSTMFLVPPVNDQTKKSLFQYPTDRMTTMHVTVFSPQDVMDFSVNRAEVKTSSYIYFPGSRVVAKLLKLHAATQDRNFIIKKTEWGFGLIGVSTTENEGGPAFRLGFSLASFHMVDYSPVPSVYPGDGLDNDKDDSIDEEECITDRHPMTKDCSNNFGSERDEKGYSFFVVFPVLDTPTKFTVDIMANGPLITSSGEILHQAICEPSCTISQNVSNDMLVFTYVDECLCMGMNTSGVFKLGTLLRFPGKEYTVSVSIYGLASMATYLALPFEVLGTEHYAVTYCGHGGYCACAVSTLYAKTNVFIKLPPEAGATDGQQQYVAGSIIRQTLQGFETLMFLSSDDLTGTYIKTDAPVSLVCGGSGTNASYLEQIPPVFSLGTSYFVPSNALIRVVATDGNTIVTGNGMIKRTVLLQSAGSHVELDQNMLSIEATKPVLVVAVSIRSNADGCMTVIISKAHFTNTQYVKVPLGADKNKIYIQNGSTRLTASSFDDAHNIWISFSARSQYQDIPGIAINLTDHDNPFLAVIFGYAESERAMFCTSIGRKVSTIENMICRPTEQTVGDGIDNDCDGLVDEDISVIEFYQFDKSAHIENGEYIPDFDLDGRADEDCFSEVPVPYTTETSSIEPTSTMSEDFESSTDVATMSENFESSTDVGTMSENFESSTDVATTSETFESSTDVATLSESWAVATTTQSSESPIASVCYCPCSLFKSSTMNITKKELEVIIEETKKKLAVNKTTLSSYIRKKTSADDSRPSAAGIGSVGVVILVLIGALVIALDVIFYKQHLQSLQWYRS